MKKRSWLAILVLVVMAVTGIAAVQAEIVPPHGMGQIGLQAVVLCDTLTIRRSPSADAEAVGTLEYGFLPIVTKEQDGWAEIMVSDSVNANIAGWVNKDFIAVDPAWYITEEKTPVYAWNDTQALKVALLDKDVSLPILKRDGDWLIVSLRGAVGWILAPEAE